MPNITPEQLTRICHDILLKFSANEEEASTIAKHLVSANLVGHDSHGVLQLTSYVDRIKKGHVVPGAQMEIVKETPTTAKINGHWGFGMVVQTKAVQLAIEKAKKNMVSVSLNQGTIPFEVTGKFGAGKVLLRPAAQGTGLIAGGAVRAVLEAVGIQNILTKCLGSHNPHNLVRATVQGLQQLESREQIAARRGLEAAQLA